MRLYRSKASIRAFINEEKTNCRETAEFIGRFSGGPLRRNLKRSGIIFSDIVFAPPFFSEAQGTKTNLIQRKTESVKECNQKTRETCQVESGRLPRLRLLASSGVEPFTISETQQREHERKTKDMFKIIVCFGCAPD